MKRVANGRDAAAGPEGPPHRAPAARDGAGRPSRLPSLAAWLWAAGGTAAAVAGMAAVGCGYFAFRGDFIVAGRESHEVFLARPPLGLLVVAAAFCAWLFAREIGDLSDAAEARRRARRLALLLSAWLAGLLPYLGLAPGGVTAGGERLFLWRAGEGLAAVAGLVATAHAVLTLRRALGPPLPAGGPRLWLLFFAVAHLPGLWMVKPWAPRFYQHRFVGGDEPEILLLTHSMATDYDFNLYNNRLKGHRNLYISPTDFTLGGTAEMAAKKAARFGAGPPQSTPEYWAERRYNMYRPGMGLVFAPGYKIGLQWGKHHLYGVFLTLCALLTVTMANIRRLVLRVTGHRGAALFAAFVAGLSPPLLFFSVSAYPDPIGAAFLAYAVRRLYEAWRDRRDSGVRPGPWACASFALAAAYMPWIHEKMLGFAAGLLVSFFFLARPAWRGTALIALVAAVSAGLQSGYYWTVYGTRLPPYVHAEPFLLSNLGAGASGMLLDQARGLAPMTPWCIAGLAGLILWLRREARFAWLPALLVAAFWITTGAFKGWTGGACPQPRYVTLVMPLLGVGLGVLWAGLRSPGIRALVSGLAAMGVLQGISGLVAADQKFRGGAAMLMDLFPSVVAWEAGTGVRVAAWLLLCGGLAALFLLRSPRLLPWCLLGPLALIAWGAWQANARPDGSRVHWGLTREAIGLLGETGPLDNTFNRRVRLFRWLRPLYPEVERRVTAIPAAEQAEDPDLRPPEGSIREDADAGGGRCVALDGAGKGVAGGVLQTLIEGRYRTEFALRRIDGNGEMPAGRVSFTVTAGQAMKEELAAGAVEVASLSTRWTWVGAPFELAAPRRMVGARVVVDGDLMAGWDAVRFVWLP